MAVPQISQIIAQLNPADVRGAMQKLASAGLIRNPADRAGLFSVMSQSPGYPKRAGLPTDQDISEWINSHAYEFNPSGYGDDRFAPGFDVAQSPYKVPSGRVGAGLYCLSAETATTNAAEQADTSTIALKQKYKKAILWLNTGGGAVRRITAITKGTRPAFFGEISRFPASLVDLELEGTPLRQGLYVGDIEESFQVDVVLGPITADTTWEVYVDAFVVETSDQADRFDVSRAFHPSRQS